MITMESLRRERELLKSKIEVQSGPYGMKVYREFHESKLKVIEGKIADIKKERALEEDVNFCIYSMYEDFSEEELGKILATAVKTHGLEKVIGNLLSRNQTAPISDLIELLKTFGKIQEAFSLGYKMRDL